MEPRPQAILIFGALFFLYPVISQSQTFRKLDNTTDQQALLIFKSKITDDPYGVRKTWNTNTSLCNWRGVTCNITKLRVTSLSLDNLGLSGPITPYIANLSFLSVFNFTNNSFHGSIPNDFGRLFRLQFLLLDSNLIQDSIPPSLSLCCKLLLLDLSMNKLEGTIPYELDALTELQVLQLSENFFTGSLPLSLGKFSSLTNLLLIKNSLQGSIPEEVGRLPFLINLQFDLNNITSELPFSLLNSSSLLILSMALNKISGSLPSDMFSKLTSLTTLYVGGNNLAGSIPPSLVNASRLEQIDLSVNNFDIEQFAKSTSYKPGEICIEGIFRNSTAVSLFGNPNLCGGVPGLELPICTAVPQKHSGKSRVKLIIELVARFTAFGLLSGLFLFLLRKTKSGNRVSTKGDFYSFGILVLEVFTRKKPTDEMFTWDFNVQKWVSMALPNRIMDVVDPELIGINGDSIAKCLVSAINIGLMCAKELLEDRPTMRDVSVMLRSVVNKRLS
ncbi:hypothetical protein GIB67_007833 [Kingdonia uniflora]|uniref:Leucine-rich repeat-containing N-terminal plant-type domain-containing protein n=1 Tax=Kingdonia uniflora TaxID=39325 RepID=A0A7J7N2E1_9MAGN|nr:hypothetical protein GIB67_007833 [Kingdonia uniflora]